MRPHLLFVLSIVIFVGSSASEANYRYRMQVRVRTPRGQFMQPPAAFIPIPPGHGNRFGESIRTPLNPPAPNAELANTLSRLNVVKQKLGISSPAPVPPSDGPGRKTIIQEVFGRNKSHPDVFVGRVTQVNEPDHTEEESKEDSSDPAEQEDVQPTEDAPDPEAVKADANKKKADKKKPEPTKEESNGDSSKTTDKDEEQPAEYAPNPEAVNAEADMKRADQKEDPGKKDE